MGLLDALKKIEKIIRENGFKQIKKKKCRLKFNLRLALILVQLSPGGKA